MVKSSKPFCLFLTYLFLQFKYQQKSINNQMIVAAVFLQKSFFKYSRFFYINNIGVHM